MILRSYVYFRVAWCCVLKTFDGCKQVSFHNMSRKKESKLKSTEWKGISGDKLVITHKSVDKLWIAMEWGTPSTPHKINPRVPWCKDHKHLLSMLATSCSAWLHCHEHAQHTCPVHTLLASVSALQEGMGWCPNLLLPLVSAHVLPWACLLGFPLSKKSTGQQSPCYLCNLCAFWCLGCGMELLELLLWCEMVPTILADCIVTKRWLKLNPLSSTV